MSEPSSPATAGLVLAAGAGRRMGRPKALVEGWLSGSVAALRRGGCDPVVVVLGAGADVARSLLRGQDVVVVIAEDWDEGMGASLRAGLRSLAADEDGPDGARGSDRAAAVLVTLVDLPDVGARVVARMLERPIGEGTLARAAYDGAPGHPVLLGRDHWTAAAETASGDRGARGYLAAHDVELVECGDLATGRDVDECPTGGQPAAE